MGAQIRKHPALGLGTQLWVWAPCFCDEFAQRASFWGFPHTWPVQCLTPYWCSPHAWPVQGLASFWWFPHAWPVQCLASFWWFPTYLTCSMSHTLLMFPTYLTCSRSCTLLMVPRPIQGLSIWSGCPEYWPVEGLSIRWGCQDTYLSSNRWSALVSIHIVAWITDGKRGFGHDCLGSKCKLKYSLKTGITYER